MNVARLQFQLEKSGLQLPTKIIKRDGAQVTFDIGRIEKALEKCYVALQEIGIIPSTPVKVITNSCATVIASRYGKLESFPSVEQIQDLVEITLLTHNEVDTAKAYISYRDSHAKLRGDGVPDHVREAFEIDAQYFPTPMQRFAFYDKYSRFNYDEMRRESWGESVDRVIDHLKWEVYYHLANENAKSHDGVFMGYQGVNPIDVSTKQYSEFMNMPISDEIWERLRTGILEMKVMPSMRLLALAGKAARRDSMTTYNCSALAINSIDAIVEILLISFAGCGVGFSVESENVEQFPRIKRQTGETLPTHIVEDSAQGWAESLRVGLKAWWAGVSIDFDLSLLRPAGAVLKTKGGRSSGPEPLRYMLDSIKEIVLSRQGTFLTTLNAHDIACHVGEAAVSGGVRRTALISLFDWNDKALKSAKSGEWGSWPKIRKNANNSAVWPENISDLAIMNQMTEMMFACSGEPGIFSRDAALSTMLERRKVKNYKGYLINPCGEQILRNMGLCNLSQAIARSDDTFEILKEKIELATILGTIQALSTRFPGMRPEWKQNCEEERLLGVDLTAQNDCKILRETNDEGRRIRKELLDYCIRVNEEYASILGINPAASITCNKPAGNSTGFIGASSSGIHMAFAPYYIRRAIVSGNSPVFRVLQSQNVPMERSVYDKQGTDWVIEFPMMSPAGSRYTREMTVIDQLEFWLMNKIYWTTNNPSFTCVYHIHEVSEMVSWICKHKNVISGLSFLPRNGAIYPQMPYEEITESEYLRRVLSFPEIDWSLLYEYEREDMTTAAQTLSCFAGSCEF